MRSIPGSATGRGIDATQADPIGFTVSIEVTAVEAKHDAQSADQIRALLRAAVRETYANKRLDGDQDDVGAMVCASGPGAPIGGQNGLN